MKSYHIHKYITVKNCRIPLDNDSPPYCHLSISARLEYLLAMTAMKGSSLDNTMLDPILAGPERRHLSGNL
jgi:hypothetical protein